MNVHRAAWRGVCAALTVVGISAALIASPAALLFLMLVFALVIPMLLFVPASEHGQRAPDWRRVTIARALGVAMGTSAFVGFATILDAAAFALALLLLAGSPYAVTACNSRSSSAVSPTGPEPKAPAPAFQGAIPEEAPEQLVRGLPALTDEQLCQAWRDSCASLRNQSGEAGIMRAVRERQSYLDEMERRNASGLTAWLTSGAMTIDDPLPYLRVEVN